MRRFGLYLLGGLLCACSGTTDLFSGNSVPREVVLQGLEGQVSLRMGINTAWYIESDAAWLDVSPTSGIGPRNLSLKASFPAGTQDIPEYNATIRVLGDAADTIQVRLPLTKVTGTFAQVPQQRQAVQATQAPSVRALRVQRTLPPVTEVLVKYKTGTIRSLRQLEQNPKPSGVAALSFDGRTRIAKLKTNDVDALISQLKANPQVEWAAPNGWVSAQAEPTDQFVPRQWYLRQTGARFAHLERFSTPVTVAVADTGVRYDHPDLQGRLWQPGEGAYDFVGDTSDACTSPEPAIPDTNPQDPCDVLAKGGGSHGTHVTGIIVANAGEFTKACDTCTASGIVGLAYAAPVKVLPLRVLDTQGFGSYEDVALAVRYAAGLPVQVGTATLTNPNPAKIINLSLGAVSTPETTQVMCEAIAEVSALGVSVVAAGGNFQDKNPGQRVYPAACAGAIAVGGVDSANSIAFYSQQNSDIDLVAPGGNTSSSTSGEGGILSTTWNYLTNLPNYTFYMGTSQAAPQVAAALAMVISANKASTPTQAYDLIKSKLTDLGPTGRDNAYGDGFLNLPGVFGWTLVGGGYSLYLQGPTPRRVSSTASVFTTYVIPGVYQLQVCIDRSENALCDIGEPTTQRTITIPRGEYDLGELDTNP